MEGLISSKGLNVEKNEFIEIVKLLPSLAEEGFLTEFECLQITSTSTLADRRLAVYKIMMSKSERRMFYIAEKFRKITTTLCNDEKNEFNEIAKLLPSLAEEGFLTDLECHQIISTGTLSDRRLAVYGIMMSKTQREMAYIGEKFRRMTMKIKTGIKIVGLKEESVTSTSGDPMLMNNYVIEHLFRFIPIKDMKNCCLVSRTWNSAVQPILRSRSTVYFDSFNRDSLRLSTFLDTFDPSLHSAFTTFKFSSNGTEWISAQLDGFFEKWGDNIKKLELEKILLTDKKDARLYLRTYNISHWISVSPKLKELSIICGYSCTQIEVDLNCLKSVGTICLNNRVIIVPPKNIREIVPIAPSTIQLRKIKFISDKENVNESCLKDCINFSKASKFIVSNMGKLNLSSLELHIKCLHLIKTEVEDWAACKGSIEFLHLDGGSFTLERSQLQIKQLLLSLYTKIDLSVLPKSVEKIHFSEIHKIVCNREYLQLPKLNFLGFTVSHCYDYLHVMADFANCANLVEIELRGPVLDQLWRLNLDWVPKSVKRMKLTCIEHLRVDGNTILELDTLILEDDFEENPDEFYGKLMYLIKPKVLVVSFLSGIRFDTTDIIKFVLKNPQFEKVVFGSRCDWNFRMDIPFQRSILSRFVDKRAHCYEFEDGRGISISRGDFEDWTKMNQLNEDCCPNYY